MYLFGSVLVCLDQGLSCHKLLVGSRNVGLCRVLFRLKRRDVNEFCLGSLLASSKDRLWRRDFVLHHGVYGHLRGVGPRLSGMIALGEEGRGLR